MAQAQRMSERSIAFEGALNDLATLLQQIAMAQVVPNSLALDAPERPTLLELASNISPEKVQLYYQITLLGRRDLGLAPDEFAGFTMTLLRMLAFSQSDQVATSAPSGLTPVTSNKVESVRPVSASEALKNVALKEVIVPAPILAEPAQTIAEEPVSSSPSNAVDNLPEATPLEATSAVESFSGPQFNGNWRQLVDNLKLGLAKTLATHCELESFDENNFNLTVPETQKHLLEASYQDKLSGAINDYFDRKIKLNLKVGGTGNTPAQQIFEEKAAIQSEAVAAIQQDDFVQALIKDFGAQIVPSSIKPINQN
jgi:DNA polymerase-3 subunit gamma/tau